MIWISICVLLVCEIVALPLLIFIYKHISSKPLVSITLADLVYQDMIIYTYSLSLAYVSAVVHSIILDDNNSALNFKAALSYSLVINFFVSTGCVSITICSTLRLISLLKVSEEAGLQLLGPDNVAVVIIRLVSFLISTFSPFFTIYYFGAYPLTLGLFYRTENHSNLEDLQENIFGVLYMLFPALSVAVGLSVELYSKFAKKSIKNGPKVFVIYKPHVRSPRTRNEYMFSIIHMTTIPLLLLSTFLQSFYTRKQRLLFHCPLLIFISCIILPLSIIRENTKLRQSFIDEYLEPFQMGMRSCQSKCRKILNRKVVAF